MAHYAFLDKDNIVTEVIPGRNEDEVVDGISDWETYYGDFRGQVCKRTSYNNNYRKNYALPGFTFREDLNKPDRAFISPSPYPSWILDEETCRWVPPIAIPKLPVGSLDWYDWNEETQTWDLVEVIGEEVEE